MDRSVVYIIGIYQYFNVTETDAYAGQHEQLGLTPVAKIDYFHGIIDGEAIAQDHLDRDFPADRMISMTWPGPCLRAVRFIQQRWVEAPVRSARYGRRMIVAGQCLARVVLRERLQSQESGVEWSQPARPWGYNTEL